MASGPSTAGARAPRAGFSLLEVAVAMAILGLGLVTLLQALSGGLRLEEKAGRLGRAVLQARALMDEVLWKGELRDGVEDGVTVDGLRWRRTVRHAAPEEGGEARDLDFELDYSLRVLEVVVGWDELGREKTFELQSMRLAPEVE
jgi:general secretion pathway protein I